MPRARRAPLQRLRAPQAPQQARGLPRAPGEVTAEAGTVAVQLVQIRVRVPAQVQALAGAGARPPSWRRFGRQPYKPLGPNRTT